MEQKKHYQTTYQWYLFFWKKLFTIYHDYREHMCVEGMVATKKKLIDGQCLPSFVLFFFENVGDLGQKKLHVPASN